MKTSEWQERCSLFLGVWLFLSPWMLRFFHWADMGTVNFLVMGVVVAALAMAALYMHMHALWEDGVTLALGLWLVISPQAIGFTDNFLASANAAIVGVFLMGLALSEINRDIHKDNGDKSATAH